MDEKEKEGDKGSKKGKREMRRIISIMFFFI